MPIKVELLEKIEKRKAVCSVIGLGYVGLPLAVELAEAGFTVYGLDTDTGKITSIKDGTSYIQDVPSERLKRVVSDGLLRATDDSSILSECDTVNICVPTPLSKTRDPDISFIVQVIDEAVLPNLHTGMLIILESTTYPGTTDEVVLPAITDAGLKVGEDIFVAFSPERVDPGNPEFNTGNIPKIVGGTSLACGEVATVFYEQFLNSVHTVTSTSVAEMIKIHENTFRSVNIALVNELALMCHKMGIDVWEVIDGAATKPFGFMPFYPGPGLGGHCIPIDPYYLSWKARSVGFEARFIELAGQVNSSMPMHAVRRASDALNSTGKSVKGSHVLIIGVAYKKNIDDVRESPAYDIAKYFIQMGANLSYVDPYVQEFEVEDSNFKRVDLTEKVLVDSDLVIIITEHDVLDFDLIRKKSSLILDTRNAIKDRIEKVWRI